MQIFQFVNFIIQKRDYNNGSVYQVRIVILQESYKTQLTIINSLTNNNQGESIKQSISSNYLYTIQTPLDQMMSQLQNKAKKMTFDEYENRITSKQAVNKSHKKAQQNIKRNSTTRSQYSQKRFADTKSQVNHSHRLDQYSQQSSTQPLAANNPNHNQNHQNSHKTIPAPISHTLPNQIINNHHSQTSLTDREQVSKIDLIFQKEPEDVQKKLRMLLLNYNAVMQYNQEEDKFQVDLLLPFNTLEEKETFVQKFMKTRTYIKDQIQQHQHNQDQMSQNMQIQNELKGNNQLSKQNDKQNTAHFNLSKINHQTQNYPHHEQNDNRNYQPSKTYQVDQKPNEQPSYQEGDNVLSTSLREQSQKIQQQKQKQLKQKDNKVDFFALSQSLDLSIQRAFTLIHQEKIVNDKREHESHERSKSHNQDGQILNIKRPQTLEDNRLNLPQCKYEQSHSEIESQISQGIKASVPYSIERNIMNTPSGKKASNQSAWLKPLQPNQSQGKLANSSLDYSHQQSSRMIKPSGHSLYESPIVPLKHGDLFDKSYNMSSNEILIEDEILDGLDDYDMESFQTPQRYGTYHIEQDSYNSAFDMIEETAQQHQEEYFPTSKEYNQFLKNKIHETAVIGRNSAPKQYQGIYSRQSSSSLRAKYSQFLKKNHRKIQNLYLRIGKQMQKKKGQEQNSFPFSIKRPQQSQGQILVADNDDSMTEKQVHEGILEDYKKRIVIENDSMSSEDKVRYFRYLAKHAKGLYIDYIRAQHGARRNS